MEYMGNKNYWENKFISRSDHPLAPEPSLVNNLIHLKKGSVLDIACGDGRNTLFLLEHGFQVTGIDFSAEALKRLNRFATENGFTVGTKQIDLSKPDSLNEIGRYDTIVINHYRLSKSQLNNLPPHLEDDGIIFVCGFGHKHLADANIRSEDLIQPDDFSGISKAMEQIYYQEEKDNRGFFVTYIFRKKRIIGKPTV